MLNKKILWGFVLLIVVIGAFFWIYWRYSNIGFLPEDLVLSEDKLITDQTIINLIVNDLKSPSGNNLTKIILDESAQTIIDGPEKIAYYVCNNGEHRGWIYYNNGKYFSLYGPYGWCLV